MKISIRRGTFETNSSSVHALCVNKEMPDMKKFRHSNLHLSGGEFGWGFDVDYDMGSYLITAIIQCSSDVESARSRLKKLDAFFNKYDIQYTIANYHQEHHSWNNIDAFTFDRFSYIDHGDEIIPLIDKLLDNHDLLARFLFGEGNCVVMANDNDGYSLTKLNSHIKAMGKNYEVFE